MRELMSPPIPFPDADHMKSKISLESVRLFALNGYHAVTVEDIADAANVTSHVVHHHFASKLDLMESLMLSLEEMIHSFYDMLDRLSNEATSFPGLVNNLFLESKEEVNPFSVYGIYCAMIHQFSLECCRHLYYDVYFMEGHMVMQRQLHTAIRRGLVKPFNVEEVAATITNCFVTMIGFNTGHLNDDYKEFDSVAWYERQMRHLLQITGLLDQ